MSLSITSFASQFRSVFVMLSFSLLFFFQGHQVHTEGIPEKEKNGVPTKKSTSASSEESKSPRTQQPTVRSSNSPVKKNDRPSASLQDTGVKGKPPAKPLAAEANAGNV